MEAIVMIQVKGHVELADIDIGSLEIKSNGREYVLDIDKCTMSKLGDNTYMWARATEDRDTFPDNKYDLTESDLPTAEAVLFFECEREVKTSIIISADSGKEYQIKSKTHNQ